MVNDKINVVGTNIAEKAIMIWNVADMLRDPFKPHEWEYPKVCVNLQTDVR